MHSVRKNQPLPIDMAQPLKIAKAGEAGMPTPENCECGRVGSLRRIGRVVTYFEEKPLEDVLCRCEGCGCI